MYIQSTCDPSCWGKNECDRNGELLIFCITEPLLKFIPQNFNITILLQTVPSLQSWHLDCWCEFTQLESHSWYWGFCILCHDLCHHGISITGTIFFLNQSRLQINCSNGALAQLLRAIYNKYYYKNHLSITVTS